MQRNVRYVRRHEAGVDRAIAEACLNPEYVCLYASPAGRHAYLLRWSDVLIGTGGVISAGHGLAEHIELCSRALAAIRSARQRAVKAAA